MDEYVVESGMKLCKKDIDNLERNVLRKWDVPLFKIGKLIIYNL